MARRKQGPETVSPPRPRRVDPAVEERRRVIVALLRQHPDGLTAREIGEATGVSQSLTASAISGLFTRGVLHKRGHRYVLAAQDEAIDAHNRPKVSHVVQERNPRKQHIWEIAEEFFRDIPEEEIARLPVDGAAQHDHYIYGLPKRPA